MLYVMLKHRHGKHVNRIWLWALAGALQDRHWNSLSGAEKAQLDAATEDDLEVGGG